MDELAALIAEFQRISEEQEYMRKLQEQQQAQQQAMMQQRQQQGGGLPPGAGSVASNFMGGGAGGGGEAAGMGGMGIAGIIAAAIAAQHGMSNATNTEFEGQRTDDAFAGHYGTEPWLAFGHDKLGLDPTAGERFDAAIANGDYGTAMKRSPAMLDYWADPGRNWAGSTAEAIGGKKLSTVVNPLSAILKLFG